ncbi:hypothetical protein CJ030_MR7G000896 [Morella rubra]|uniref:Protein kinase domain-containing protein n=1 Tax=Morella rubra TaxID=262757 RepID=A0A6A1UYU2_9ROSI|nr:hypothetical protein CJ030_MR7G000896 [Morella rubra]
MIGGSNGLSIGQSNVASKWGTNRRTVQLLINAEQIKPVQQSFVHDKEKRKALEHNAQTNMFPRGYPTTMFPVGTPPCLPYSSLKSSISNSQVDCRVKKPHIISCSDYNIYYGVSNTTHPNTSFPYVPSGCSILQLPVNPNPHEHLNGAALAEFDLQLHVSDDCYKCYLDGLRCQSNAGGVLYCEQKAPEGKGINKKVVILARKSSHSIKLVIFGSRKVQPIRIWRPVFRNYEPIPIRRYSYSNIKQMTNFFKDKLGQGGYGGVYKGKLPDGSLVAVKVLKESRGTGEFINEVASIGRTSHVNIVTLMGFCFEDSKRALIYEFMPNGSLDKFIYKKNLVNNEQDWSGKCYTTLQLELLEVWSTCIEVATHESCILT